jgi:hypothetical protein
MYYLIEAFMLQWDGLAPGTALNGARSLTVAGDSFAVLATLTPSPSNITEITCSSLRALAVFVLFCRRDYASSFYQCINKYLVTEKGCVPVVHARSWPVIA